MPLASLLHELDNLTTDEKLQAIQHLSTSLLQASKPSQVPTPKSKIVSQVEMNKAPSKAVTPLDIPVHNSSLSQTDNGNKINNKSTNQKKDYPAEQISEVAPNGKRYVVTIPGWQMIEDYAKDVGKALAEKYNDPSYTKYETVHGFADFIRLVARIKAKAMIRKEITGSEYPEPETPPSKPKRRKRQENDRANQKMIITRVGDGHYHIDYEDLP